MTTKGPTGNLFFPFCNFPLFVDIILTIFLSKKKKNGKKRFCGRPTGHNSGHPLNRKQTLFFKGGLRIIFKIKLILRLGKYACPRVNDDQKKDVDDQKLNSGRPHDYWILGCLFYKIFYIFSFFLPPCKGNTPEDDHTCLWTTTFCILVVL